MLRDFTAVHLNVANNRVLFWRYMSLVIFMVLNCCVPSATAQTAPPSYLGPYAYGLEAYDLRWDSEKAVVDFATAQDKKSPGMCDVIYKAKGNWVDVDLSRGWREYAVNLWRWSDSVCKDYGDTRMTLHRHRLVCTSTQIFDPSKSKCIDLYDVRPKGKKGSNVGPPCGDCGKKDDHVGQPVNPATGNMWHVISDYRSLLPNGLTLERTYNSLDAGLNSGAANTAMFGTRWTNKYASRIRHISTPPTLPPLDVWSLCKARADTNAIVSAWTTPWVHS